MRIAIFHNYLDNIGGAEMVALYLARELSADIYTTNINQEKIEKMGFSDVLPRIFSIGKLPKKAPFRQQLAFFKFRHLNLSAQYDFFIIAGDWAMSAAVNNQPNMWYVHSPLNELWQFYGFIKKNLLSNWKKIPYDIWVCFNRRLTLKYSKSVNIWVANSVNTRNRIKRFYHKEAQIIYPPVDTKKFDAFLKNKNRSNYFLSVNRLVKHKRIDLQLQAFRDLPNEKLIIVGSYEKGVSQFEDYKEYLEKIKPNNVEILNWLSSDEITKLYYNAKAFIATAKDEDFGLTPVEAMSYGKPVIAAGEGGYLETVVQGKTGVLIKDIDSKKIIEAVHIINSNLSKDENFYQQNSLKRAEEFSLDKFIKKIKKTMECFKKYEK
ncbi:glycosyltransferase [Patescibacteria group bacterium]|nr:glycosyltransferase [Patescibacteria group bacterium]